MCCRKLRKAYPCPMKLESLPLQLHVGSPISRHRLWVPGAFEATPSKEGTQKGGVAVLGWGSTQHLQEFPTDSQNGNMDQHFPLNQQLGLSQSQRLPKNKTGDVPSSLPCKHVFREVPSLVNGIGFWEPRPPKSGNPKKGSTHKVFRCPELRQSRSLDASPALALAGVVQVFTGKDLSRRLSWVPDAGRGPCWVCLKIVVNVCKGKRNKITT